ncbi:MAG TPA: type II secretion system F family protein [Geminicoccus sp.]|jgi:tight adherence protein B|uniref:type II secretion system F family protein n=1 Tax=Geminicoccus sp. TaxID=2024832 RepID=UPI002E3699E4|nr:type II secretion system F family protein [Geminicoccus sp.]HEX2526649.1 type II secretion system F family protein [Geminicoccus sp.]
MHDTNRLLALGAALLAVLLISVATWLLVRERSRKLRGRVNEFGVRGRVEKAAADAMPSIRVAAQSDQPFRQRLSRLLGFHPDLPEEQVLAWPVVMLLATGIGLSGWWIAGFYLGKMLALPMGMISAVLGARMIFRWQHRKYCDALFKQVPDALGLILRAVRSGLPMAEALRSVARDMPAPTGPQFARIVGETAIGNSVGSAFFRLYDRTQVTEYGFLAVTLGLQAQTGGSLGETLENLAEIVRKRVALAARAKALASESTTSAVILIILPFICALAMSVIRPGYLNTFWSEQAGFKMMVTGLTLMTLGSLTIRWLIRRATED